MLLALQHTDHASPQTDTQLNRMPSLPGSEHRPFTFAPRFPADIHLLAGLPTVRIHGSRQDIMQDSLRF
jgi:hypothetical protein